MEDECAATATATAVSANSNASCTNTLGLSAPLATGGVAAGLADATSLGRQDVSYRPATPCTSATRGVSGAIV